MWNERDIVRAGSAIIVTLVGWVLIRLVPPLDYYPPESRVLDLGPSWFATAGIRQPVKAGYATVALVLMALFFSFVQERWPGRGALKGLAFGAWLGVVWIPPRLGFSRDDAARGTFEQRCGSNAVGSRRLAYRRSDRARCPEVGAQDDEALARHSGLDRSESRASCRHAERHWGRG